MGETQIIDGLDDEYKKRFMHHDNFPQYSVGSTGRYGAPGRREIGHGALGERVLSKSRPALETSLTLSAWWQKSWSQTVLHRHLSQLAPLPFMAGGVPIKAPVAGIAMGLILRRTNYTVLTDIQGLEDHFGDMDFKSSWYS